MSDSDRPSTLEVHGSVEQQVIALGPLTVVTPNVLTWERLEEETEAWRHETRNTIGDVVSLVRHEEMAAIHAAQTARVLLVSGSSGAGKSALVARVAARSARSFIALTASDAIALEQSAHPRVSSLFAGAASAPRTLVLDALERATSDEDFRALGRIVRSLRLGDPAGVWQLIATCQSTALDRVEEGLRQVGIDWSATRVRVDIPLLTKGDLAFVGNAIPALQIVVLRDELGRLWSQPKVLDLVAAAASAGRLPDAEWVTESDVVAWFSEQYVVSPTGERRASALLQRLAAEQADRAGFATAISTIAAEDLDAVGVLERQGIVAVREEALRFTHDLYGDFARARWLVGQFAADNLAELRARVRSRPWENALRLFALAVMERGRGDDARLEAWLSLDRLVSAGAETTEASLDLWLEAVSRSTLAHELLPAISGPLFANGAKLAKRLINQFVYSASKPMEAVAQTLKEASPHTRLAAEARYRDPDRLAWFPLVSWVIRDGKKLVEACSSELLRFAGIWLMATRSASDYPGRAQLGELLLRLAEREAQKRSLDSPERQWLFYVVIENAAVLDPDRFARLMRTLAGRVPRPPKPSSPGPSPNHSMAYLLRNFIPREPVGPWPDGPLHEPDEDLVAIVLKQNVASAALVRADGVLALEVFLALLIEAPHTRDPMDLGRHNLELRHQHYALGYQPFGPFHALLDHDPALAIELAIRILDFATERDMEVSQRRRDEASAASSTDEHVAIEVNGTVRTFVGSSRVFDWSAGMGNVVGNVATTLENWLSTVPEGDALVSALRLLLERSNSVAVLGVLLDVGLERPALFSGILEPIITSPEVVWWSMGRSINFQTHLAHRAESRPHLLHDVGQLVVRMFKDRNCAWPAMDRARARWLKKIDAGAVDERFGNFLRRYGDLFDPARWSRDAVTGEWEYSPSPPSVEEMEHERSEVFSALRTQAVLALPFYFQAALDSKESPVPEEFESRFSALETLPELPEGLADLVGGLDGLRAMAAAVALRRCPDWAANTPERLAKCIDWLLAPLERRDARARRSYASDVSESTWNVLVARVLPARLAAAPRDARLRRAVAVLVCNPQYRATQHLFREARRVLERDEFDSLMHLGVRHSRRVFLETVARRTGLDPRVLRREEARDIDAFVRGKIAPLKSDWRLHAQHVPRWVRRSKAPLAGFDEETLHAIFAWLPDEWDGARNADLVPLVEAIGAPIFERMQAKPRELNPPRRSFLSTVRGLFRRPPPSLPMPSFALRERPERPFPYPVEMLPIRWTAAVLVRSADPALRRRLWYPWVTLPVEFSAFSKALIGAIYDEGLDRDDADAVRFAGILSELHEHAQTEGWLSGGKVARGALDAVMALFGRDDVARLADRWTESRRLAASALVGPLEHFIGLSGEQPRGIAFACELLLTPAFSHVRSRSLAWFAKLPLTKIVSHSEALSTLLLLLRSTVSERTDAVVAASFNALLAAVLETNDARAMALKHSLASV